MNDNTRATFDFFVWIAVFMLCTVAFFIGYISEKIGGYLQKRTWRAA